MKMKFLCLSLLVMTTSLSAQKKIDEEVNVHYTQLPKIVMNDVNTYNCRWNAEEVKANIPTIESEYGFSDQAIKGFLSLQGYEYKEQGADITLTLNSSNFTIPEPEIVNLGSSASPNYRAKYIIRPNWNISIEGKFSKTINIGAHSEAIEVILPALTNSYGAPTAPILKEEALTKFIEENASKVNKHVTTAGLNGIFTAVKDVAISELSYKSINEEIEIESFKSSKKVDMSAWDAPYAEGIIVLNEISKGENPQAVYDAHKTCFDFWNTQFEEGLADPKENKKTIKVAASNLVKLLALTNPKLITDKYIEYASISKELKVDIDDYKVRQELNESNKVDYKKLNELSPLKNYRYEMTYTDSKGNAKPGVVVLNSPLGVNPFELTGYAITMYDANQYNSSNGKPSSKLKLDLKTVTGYSLLGYNFKRVKYSDPSVASISGNDNFVEEIILGKCKLYKNYTMESGDGMVMGAGLSNNNNSQLIKSRMEPQFIIHKEKKPTAVMNYSKLSSALEDCQTVSEKIKSGEYGNAKVEAKSSKLGKLMQQGASNQIQENIITIIIKEYNSLM